MAFMNNGSNKRKNDNENSNFQKMARTVSKPEVSFVQNDEVVEDVVSREAQGVVSLWNPFSRSADSENEQSSNNSENGETKTEQENQSSQSSTQRDAVVSRPTQTRRPARPQSAEPFNLLRELFGVPGDDDESTANTDPELTFKSCGGLEEQIKYIRDHVMLIISKKEEFKKWGVDPVKGIIFYGPPGSGKTLLAKALATELSQSVGDPFTFFMRNGTDMFGKYVGQTERSIRSLFDAAKAKKPAIIFLDEMDGMCSSRDDAAPNSKFYTGVVTQLLACMDAIVRGEVIVIGATNRLESIDPAFRRPGRFDKTLAFHAPNSEARVQILKIHTEKWKNQPQDEEYVEVASLTVGYTGADLEQLCRETFIGSLHRQFPDPWALAESGGCNLDQMKISLSDWKQAISKTSKSNSNVFGNLFYGGELINPGIRLLTSGFEAELSKKLEPLVRPISPTEAENETQIKSCLVWSPNLRSVEAVNLFVIPAFISSCDVTSIVAFRLDEGILTPRNKLDEFMTTVLETKKRSILFVPNFDQLIATAIQTHLLGSLAIHINLIRGKNILLLATASCGISDLASHFRPLFNGIGRSLLIRTITSEEAQTFFQPVFTLEFYENEQKSFNSDVGITRIVNMLQEDASNNGNESQTDPCVDAEEKEKSKLLAKFQKKLNDLLKTAVEVAKDNEIPDVLNLKGELIHAVKQEMRPNEHLAKLETVLDHYGRDKMKPRNNGNHKNMYI